VVEAARVVPAREQGRPARRVHGQGRPPRLDDVIGEPLALVQQVSQAKDEIADTTLEYHDTDPGKG
jgi:hypothetical protein